MSAYASPAFSSGNSWVMRSSGWMPQRTRSSTSSSIFQRLVTQEPYSAIELTAKGVRVARHVLERHTLLRAFLMKLGVTRRNADRDACLMEHILSAETLDKTRAYTEERH